MSSKKQLPPPPHDGNEDDEQYGYSAGSGVLAASGGQQGESRLCLWNELPSPMCESSPAPPARAQKVAAVTPSAGKLQPAGNSGNSVHLSAPKHHFGLDPEVKYSADALLLCPYGQDDQSGLLIWHFRFSQSLSTCVTDCWGNYITGLTNGNNPLLSERITVIQH